MTRSQLLDRTKACGTIPEDQSLAMVVHRYSLPSLRLGMVPDLAQQADSVFSGISTFGRLPYWPCLTDDSEKFDIAFLGSYPRHPQSFPIPKY